MNDERVLLTDHTGHVRVLTLNRPESRNALNPELIGALSDALRSATADEGVRAVVITGSGEKAFCAGMDLRAFGEARASGDGDALSFDALNWFYRGGFAKPVVAAVNGHAVAGGPELMLCAEPVVASGPPKFGLSGGPRGHVSAGVGPGGGRGPSVFALQCDMGAAEDAGPDDLHVLLHGDGRDRLGSLTDARVDHLEAGVA